jgi:hypothetical protein
MGESQESRVKLGDAASRGARSASGGLSGASRVSGGHRALQTAA